MSAKNTATVNSTITIKLFEHGGQSALISVSGQLPERQALVMALRAISRYLLNRKRNHTHIQ